jgi:hypothetical protein
VNDEKQYIGAPKPTSERTRERPNYNTISEIKTEESNCFKNQKVREECHPAVAPEDALRETLEIVV